MFTLQDLKILLLPHEIKTKILNFKKGKIDKFNIKIYQMSSLYQYMTNKII